MMESPNEERTQSTLEPPQNFEVSLARKIKSISKNLLITFQKLDVDRDGYVTRSDLKIALHNMFGIDLTRSQMDGIFARFAYFEKDHRDSVENKVTDSRHGIRYTEFVEYIRQTAEWSSNNHVSEYGSTLQLKSNDQAGQKTAMYSISPPPNAVTSDLRRALGRLLRQQTGLDMKNTHLFMGMDFQRNSRVSPDEFQQWTNRLGLILTKEQVKKLLGEHYDPWMEMSVFVALVEELKNYNSVDIGHDPGWNNIPSKNHSNQQSGLENEARQSLVKCIRKCADDAKTDKMIVKIVGNQLYQKKQRVLDAFRSIDLDGSGKLNLKEFRMAMQQYGLDLSEERVKSLMDKFDEDGDGKLDKHEFVRFISFCGDIDIGTTQKTEHNKCENEDPSLIRKSIIRTVSGHEDEVKLSKVVKQLDDDDLSAIMKFRNALDSERLWTSAAFKKFDKDRSGYLDFEELKAGFNDMRVRFNCDILSSTLPLT